MRFVKYAHFTLLLLLVNLPVFAQQTTGAITGKLIDASSNPVSYATITLLKTDSSVVNGALSDDGGSFSISGVTGGSYLLRIESIGMERKIISLQVTADAPGKKLGKIKLTTSENKLSEVNVIGEKPIMELKVDKKVFNVEKNTTTAGGSATDVLQNVPSVSVDASGNVSLRGKSDVTILIDGKPATLLGADVTSALQSLPAASIENVEVITNPSSKYDAQGTSGIINIVTKKDGRFGMNGTATLGAGTNDKYNGNLGLNARKGKWSVFLNSSYRVNNTFNDVTTKRQDSGALGQSYHTYEHVPRTFGGSFSSIGATFDPNKYNSITVTENINAMGFSFKDQSDYFVYNRAGENPADSVSHQIRSTDFGVKILSSSSAIDWKRKFKKKDEELSVDGTFAFTDFTRKQNYITSNYYTDTSKHPRNPIKENSPATGGNSTVTVWADYTDPIFTKNGKLGMGFKSQLYDFHSDNNPIISRAGGVDSTDYNLLSKYKYSQQTHAAYVNWNDQLGKFSYQAGFRFEDMIYDGSGLLPSNGSASKASFHSSFFNFFPSAFISYMLTDKQSVYLNYSRRTNRPGFMQLLPFVDLSNPGTVSTGNPGLIPEFINSVEFSYSKSDNRGDNFIASAYYARTENLIEKITTPIDAATAVKYNVPSNSLLSKPVNIASGTTYGLEGTGHFQMTRAWDATLNVNFFENQLVVGSADTALKNNNGFTWFGKINTNLKLPENFSFQVNANYESPKVITQGKLRETYWIDVALKKSFWKNKATLVLNCSDIFNTHTTYTTYDLPAFSETINRVKETRIGNITFTYRFGKTDQGKGAYSGMGGKKGKGPEKGKPVKPSDEDREKNMKEGDDNDQPGGGSGGGQRKENGGGSHN